MTKNQLVYQSNLETIRSNKAREAETERANRVREIEEERTHKAVESETNRANLVKEKETARNNVANNIIGGVNAIAQMTKAGAKVADAIIPF